MCAMMQKFRMIAGSVLPGCGAAGRLGWDTYLFRGRLRDDRRITAGTPFSHDAADDPAVLVTVLLQ
jgi:hypothetical protein